MNPTKTVPPATPTAGEKERSVSRTPSRITSAAKPAGDECAYPVELTEESSLDPTCRPCQHPRELGALKTATAAQLGSLARAAVGGCHAAREGLFRALLPVALRAARRYAGTGAAEDVAQEALLRALQRLTALEKPESVRAWLVATVINVAASRGRRERFAVAIDPEILTATTADQRPESRVDALVDARRELARLRASVRIPPVNHRSARPGARDWRTLASRATDRFARDAGGQDLAAASAASVAA
ncbi:MAG: RNA polymerase sigma factor [Sandaracinaceae bacterium]|nr:RNA polymerase sigma factor [Sandaracinaceae bacterium]